jgi:tetratricopeptide (TPR) repeat protein
LEEAIMHYWKAVANDPKYIEAYNNLGFVLQMLGRAEEAIGCYQKALTINPNYSEAHNNLGIVLRTIGQIDEALQAFDKAIALAPRRAAFYLSVVRLGRDDRYFSAMTEPAREVTSLRVCRADPSRASGGTHHPRAPRPARHGAILLLAAVCTEAGIPCRTRTVLPRLSDADGAAKRPPS